MGCARWAAVSAITPRPAARASAPCHARRHPYPQGQRPCVTTELAEEAHRSALSRNGHTTLINVKRRQRLYRA